jgi:hypothetical protein
MKRLLGIMLATITAMGLAAVTFAADKAKEKTIKGEAMCAKCELGETPSCQNAIRVKEGDKTVMYYLEQNDVSKAFHDNVCSSTKKVVATGTVKEVGGKQQFTASKIELDKQ